MLQGRGEGQKEEILGAKTFSCPLVDPGTAAIIFLFFDFSWFDNSFSCFSFTAWWTVLDLSWQSFLTGGSTIAALFWTEAVLWAFSGCLMINFCLMRDEFNVSQSKKHTKDYSSDYLQRGDRILPLLEVGHWFLTHSQSQTTLCRIWSELRFFWACLLVFCWQHSCFSYAFPLPLSSAFSEIY